MVSADLQVGACHTSQGSHLDGAAPLQGPNWAGSLQRCPMLFSAGTSGLACGLGGVSYPAWQWPVCDPGDGFKCVLTRTLTHTSASEMPLLALQTCWILRAWHGTTQPGCPACQPPRWLPSAGQAWPHLHLRSRTPGLALPADTELGGVMATAASSAFCTCTPRTCGLRPAGLLLLLLAAAAAAAAAASGWPAAARPCAQAHGQTWQAAACPA